MLNIPKDIKRKVFNALVNGEVIDGIQERDELENLVTRIDGIDLLKSEDPRYTTFIEDFRQHCLRNYDWTDEYLFVERLKVLESDNSFKSFVEAIVSPDLQESESDINKVVSMINQQLETAKASLSLFKYDSNGLPVYQLVERNEMVRQIRPSHKLQKFTFYVDKFPKGRSDFAISHSSPSPNERPCFILAHDRWNDFSVYSLFNLFWYPKEVSCCIPYLYNFTLVPTFTVPEGVKVLCNDEVQESGVSSQDFRTPVEYTLVSGTQRKVFTVTVTNTGLPVVVVNVNTPGTVSFLDFSIPAKGTKWSEADDIAVYKNGVADLNKAGCSIRLRGNTSSNYDKRPMAIKLNKKAGILGMKEHKRWILLSPWTDMSLIRNYLAFNIAQTIQNHFINGPTDGSTLGKGLVWNPSGQNVELVINGIHAGNYLFCEQIKINKNRLKMTNPIFEDVVEKNTSPTVKDCSYLIEFDNNYDETWKFKTSMRELPCLFKDDFKVTATNGTTYDGSAIFESLKTYINAIESNLTNGYYTEAYKSLDINSVIDYWFVYEIAMNDEIQHPKSVYMYKDGDGKLSAGPVWDFDSQNFTNVDTEKNAYYYHTWSSLLIERAIKYNETPRRYYMWWPLLMKDQNYINRVKARWADVYPDLIDVANRVVEERRTANRLSDEYNRKIWKVGNYLDEHWLCGDENMEFDDVMDNLKYCYNKRLENLNNTITNLRKW